MNSRLKQDLLDSLQYLSEINVTIEQYKNGKLDINEVMSWFDRRTREFGYISDFKYTYKIMQNINEYKDKG